MNTIEMVVATRIRYTQDFLFAIITLPLLCLIFKDSLIQVLEWLKETLF